MGADPLRLCGKELNGRYRIERQLGAGGMGLVYAAVQLEQAAPCAIKLIRPELGLSSHADELLRRFRREAKLGNRLRHEGLVQVRDLEQLADGTLFYVMELLGGRSAGELLRHGGAFSWEEAAELGRQAALALCALHGERLVHRDLKPANLQVLEDGRVKVLDLGVAHVSAVLEKDAPSELTDVLTRTGQYLGTPAYMAPEQMADSRRVDGRSDVYSLALVIYELCCGAQPFVGLRFEEIAQLKFLRRPVPPLRQSCPEAPAALERIIAAALGEREDRPDMAALGAALGRLLGPRQAEARQGLAARVGDAQAPLWAQDTVAAAPRRSPPRMPLPTTVTRWRRPRPRLVVAAAATILGGVGGLFALRAAMGSWDAAPAAGPAAAAPAGSAPTAAATAPTAAPVAAALPAPSLAAVRAPTPHAEPLLPADTAPPASVAPAAPRRPALERAAPGRARVMVRPFAEIFIDGQHRPEGSPHTYTLAPGRHRVRAVNTALGRDETRAVLVPPRGQVEVSINWEAP